MMSNLELIFVHILLLSIVEGFSVSGVTRLSTAYPLLLRKPYVALTDVSAKFSNGITSIVGQSGSGKSTLGKSVCGIIQHSSGSIDTISDKLSQNYMDQIFYLKYDEGRTINDYIVNPNNKGRLNISILQKALSLHIPLYTAVSNLLTSDKKLFEILFALSSITPSVSPYLLVLDEYLDKEVDSVRKKVIEGVRKLISDQDIQLQVLMITHSKGLCLKYSDHCVVLHRGRLYTQGLPTAVSFPGQINWLP